MPNNFKGRSASLLILTVVAMKIEMLEIFVEYKLQSRLKRINKDDKILSAGIWLCEFFHHLLHVSQIELGRSCNCKVAKYSFNFKSFQDYWSWQPDYKNVIQSTAYQLSLHFSVKLACHSNIKNNARSAQKYITNLFLSLLTLSFVQKIEDLHIYSFFIPE